MIKSFDGKTPQIAESAFISEAAYIIGDVEIGEHSSVWPGAVIRGDVGSIKIGSYTSVEDNCVLHAAPDSLIIGNNVQIGHGAVINNHIIGDHVLIGMNATILHESEIGSRCIIAANCLVSQGMKIPDNSFVIGVPAKVKGDISPKQFIWIEEAPQGYAKLAQKYKEEGL